MKSTNRTSRNENKHVVYFRREKLKSDARHENNTQRSKIKGKTNVFVWPNYRKTVALWNAAFVAFDRFSSENFVGARAERVYEKRRVLCVFFLNNVSILFLFCARKIFRGNGGKFTWKKVRLTTREIFRNFRARSTKFRSRFDKGIAFSGK